VFRGCTCVLRGRKMTRREVREHLFKLVFQKEFYEADLPEQESLYLSEEGLSEDASRKELTERFAQVLAHLEEIDAILSEASVGWKLKRMNKVDLSLLRVAVFEMRFDERVPEKVAINEAVELAKQFGGDDSPAFINGVLAKLATVSE
jgi:N utilization substance protein B